jgi:PAS domain S-box-containing protein
MRILQIEDNPGDAKLISEMLKAEMGAHSLHTVERLAEGLRILAAGHVDVVLLDLNLPDSSGIETAICVRNRFPHLALVVMTSIEDEGFGVQTVRQGADDYLVKGQINGKTLRRTLLYAIERKRSEEALRKSEERFSTVFRHSPMAIFLRHLSTDRIVDVNSSFLAMFGFSREEVLGRTPSDLGLWVQPGSYQNMSHALKERRQIAPLEMKFRRKSGTIGEAIVSVECIEVAGEQLILSFLDDITERRKAEKERDQILRNLEALVEERTVELRESELKYRNLIETMNEGLAIWDENDLLTFVNDKFCEILGYSRAEIIGQTMVRFCEGDSQKTYNAQLELRSQGIDQPYELVCLNKEGRKLILLISPKSLFNAQGKSVGSFGLMTDISERRQAEETIKDSEKQLRLLSRQLLTIQESERSRIARELHDQLGQDLAVTKLLIHSLEKKLPELPEMVKQESEGMLLFVDQIIDNIRRLSRDLSPAILEDLGLTAALQGLLNNYVIKNMIQIQSNLMMVDSLVPHEGHIMVYRIVQESLNNVIKHAEAQNVLVTAGMEDHQLSLVVADDGKGFEVNSANSSSHLKTRLGLRIMHERARILGGTLEIWSQPGNGTRVTLRLPVEKHS